MMYEGTLTATDGHLNQLYWNTTQTVDEIISNAGVGRNVLYASIEPLDVGSDCPTCEEALFYTNRTNRASGNATCLVCGMETMLPDSFTVTQFSPETSENGTFKGTYGARGWRDDIQAVSAERAAMIGGAAALGMLVGVAATKVLRD